MTIRPTLPIALALVAGFGMGPTLRAEAPEVIKHRVNEHAHLTFGAQPTAGSTGTIASPLINHGGSVLNTANVYVIWYGNWNQANGTDTPAGQQIIRDFLQTVGGSPYYKLNQYPNTAAQGNLTGNVTWGGEANSTYKATTRLRDPDILGIVNAAMSANGWTKGDAAHQNLFFVLTSSNVNETSGFCTKYCGWHTSTGTNGIRYSFVGNAARCITGCAAQSVSPNGNAGVDGMLSVIAHELEEAATDADPGTAPAWRASGGAENADSCAWTFGSSQTKLPSGAYYNMTLGSGAQQRNYLIQRNVKIAAGNVQTCDIQ